MAANVLRLMQVSECYLSNVFREHIGRRGMFASDENPALRAFRLVRTGAMEMSGDHDRQCAGLGPGARDRLRVEAARGLHDRRTRLLAVLWHDWQVAGT